MRIPTKGRESVISKTQLTQPLSKEVEVVDIERTADPNRSDIDAGHMYGFLLLFMTKDGLNQFEKVTNYDMGRNEFQFFGDPNLSYAPTEYFFCVPPRNITVTEPSSTIITPTLGRTFVREHQGILLRDLTITGTTGYRPAQASQSRKAARLNEFGIPNDEKTGYFNFIQIRNLFRYYQYLVANPEHVAYRTSGDKSVTLLWVNFHEGEFWECEPVSFSTVRDASNPMGFNYAVAAKLLRKFDAITFKAPDWLPDFFNDIFNFLGKIDEIITEVIEKINYITNMGVVASSVSKTVVDRVLDTGYHALSARKAISSLPTSYSGFKDSAEAMRFNLKPQLLALAAAAVKDLADDVDGDLATREEVNEDYYQSYINGSFAYDVQKKYNQLIVHRRDLDSRISPSRDLSYAPNSDEYPDLDHRSQSASSISKGAYTIDKVNAGESITDIAFRTLDNQERWEELVGLNGLVSPYISNFPSPGVLVPGNNILIPISSSDPKLDENAVFSNSAEEFSGTIKDVDLAKALYGTDLKSKFNGFTDRGNPLLDLAVENGDLATISGSDNFVQALELKTNTERGSLKLHPWYGRMSLIGMRSPLAVVTMAAVTFKQCILADPRVFDIDDMNITVEGDVLTIKMSVIGQKSLKRAPLVSQIRIG